MNLISEIKEPSNIHLLRFVAIFAAQGSPKGDEYRIPLDSISAFLLGYAYGEETSFPLVPTIVPLTPKSTQSRHLSQVSAISEFGRILANLENSLIKQKLTFVAVHRMKKLDSPTPFHKLLNSALSSNILASTTFTMLSEDDLVFLFSHSVSGLYIGQATEETALMTAWHKDTRKLALISTVKLIDCRASLVSGY